MKRTVCMIGVLMTLSLTLTTTLGEDKKSKKSQLSVTGLPARTDAAGDDSLSAAWREKLSKPFLLEKPSDQIVSKRFVLSGPLVALVKSDNPLQTFNPFATSNSDTGADTFRRDPYLPPLRGVVLLRLRF